MKTQHQLMSFLVFANYYREFIKGYADKVYPIQQLMRHKGKKVMWNNAAEDSIQRIKRELCEGSCIRHAYGKRHVRPRYRCNGGCDLRHTPPRTRMERQDFHETNSLRKQSLERHGNEVRGTQG